MPREEAAAKIATRVEAGKELKTRRITTFPEYTDVQKAYWTWDEYNEEMLRQMFTSPKMAAEYRGFSFGVAGGARHLLEETERLHEDIDAKIRQLESVRQRLELIPVAPGVQPREMQRTTPSQGAPPSNKVFVVHGHDEAARDTVARLLTVLDLEPIILHEQPSEGRTVVEKLEHHGRVGYAVVLLTPDDVGGVDSESLKPRARQNVVFELGYFIGSLGRNRVCALHRGDVELPSDFTGVVYVPMDTAGAWRFGLARELRAAGFNIDMNRL
jgi:predicted nucleotide-binding protein